MAELLLNDVEVPGRGDQETGKAAEGLAVLERFTHQPKQGRGQLGERVRCQQELFPMQAADQALDVPGLQGGAEHLAGGVRQLVGLIDDGGAGIRQDGRPVRPLVDGVRQEKVVVADLKRKSAIGAVLQKCTVPAALPAAVTGLRDADTVPVVIAEVRGSIHIQLLPEGEQGSASFPVFLAEIQLAQPPFQAVVADIVRFALADHSAQRLIEQAILHKYTGQEGQIFSLYGILQGNAGSGNKDRAELLSADGAVIEVYRPRRQVGVGFPNACPGVAVNSKIK